MAGARHPAGQPIAHDDRRRVQQLPDELADRHLGHLPHDRGPRVIEVARRSIGEPGERVEPVLEAHVDHDPEHVLSRRQPPQPPRHGRATRPGGGGACWCLPAGRPCQGRLRRSGVVPGQPRRRARRASDLRHRHWRTPYRACAAGRWGEQELAQRVDARLGCGSGERQAPCRPARRWRRRRWRVRAVVDRRRPGWWRRRGGPPPGPPGAALPTGPPGAALPTGSSAISA